MHLTSLRFLRPVTARLYGEFAVAVVVVGCEYQTIFADVIHDKVQSVFVGLELIVNLFAAHISLKVFFISGTAGAMYS